VNQEIDSRPGMGDCEGPLTECQAAAVTYREWLGVPIFADARSVWLYVPADRAAISVTAPLADVVSDALHASGIDGPVVARPAGHKIFLCQCDPIACPRWPPPAGHAVVHLGYHSMIDLPPTPFPPGQVVTRLSWLHAPEPNAAWPSCHEVLDVIVRCVDQ
jgi:hypothetical protein